MTHAEIAKAAVAWALTKVGYKYSQARRTQEKYFDCSSLVARAYRALGKLWGYRGPVPISCNEVYDDDFELLWPATYAEIGKKLGGSSVIAKAKRPGDLQFLHTLATGRANRITHITMVASPTQIIHARGTAYGVRKDPINHYAGKVCALTRYNPDCDLVYGHKGNRTKALQKALNAEAGAGLSGDGEYGPKTRDAVKAYQKAAGLPVTGKGDAATLRALGLIADQDADTPNDGEAETPVENVALGARVLKRGDEGEDVADLQEGFLTLGGAAAGYDLGNYGDNKDGVDGEYGSMTAACVLRFQTRAGLPGTGIFDAATAVAFAEALAALLADEADDGHEPDEDAPQEDETLYPSGGYIPDASSNQVTFRAEQVAKVCPFIIMRARVSGKTDATYKARAAQLLALGMPHWAYDYVKTTSVADAVKQADAMYDLTKPYKPIGLYLDVETLADGVTYADSRDHVRAYVAQLRARAAADGTAIKIGCYMGTSRHDSHYKSLDGLFDTLWPATWGKNNGYLSKMPEYGDLHQYTSMFDAKSASIGIPGGRDMNRLTGRKPLNFFTGRQHDGIDYYGVAKVTGGSVNIRSGASANSKRLGTVSKGAIFERRAGDVDGWTAIYYKGQEAYISAQYVKLITG
jgi:peptidoglycan hydrolase-like protein with peptidoglycan-binding domain